MEKEEIYHDCMTGTPPEEQNMAQQKRRPSLMTEKDAAEDGTFNPVQTRLEMDYENSAGFSLKAGGEDYDGDIDSDRNSNINKSGDAELEKYTKQAKLWSLIEGSNTSPRISGGAFRDDEAPQEQEEDPEEQKPEPGLLRVRVPNPENSAKRNPSHLQYYSPPLRPKGGRSSSTRMSCRPDPYHRSISPTSSSSSSFVNLNEHASMEGPKRKALEKLTDDQLVAMADENIDEAKQFLIEVNSTKDERANALTLMTDWNDVKANAQQRKIRSLTTDVALHKHGGLAEPLKLAIPEFDSAALEQEGTGTRISSKGRRRLRKRLSAFFKKTPALSEVNVTSKSALSIRAPIVKADNRLNAAEVYSRTNMVNTTDVNTDVLPDEGTSTVSSSWSESTLDHDEAMKSDDDAPPMPIMPMRLAEPETPEVKRNYRNIHVIGSSPDHTVIIDNTNAYFSPDKRHYRQPAKITDAASANSGDEHGATTSDVAGKRSVGPFDANLISEHAENSAIHMDDTPFTPTRKRRPKTSNAARKHSKSRSILKKRERSAKVDENDAVTPTQQSFDASAYSGDEDSVHTAKGVPMTSRKATIVDIPARRGNKYPATIDKDDPHNMALFSNPPDKDLIRIEIEAEANAAQRADVAADEAMAKRQEDAPAELKTKRGLINFKNACKAKEEKVDEHKEEARSDHKKEDEDNRSEEDKREEGTEDTDKRGGCGNERNGTARARMEGY